MKSLDPARWRRLLELLDDLLEADSVERGRRLGALAGPDVQLRPELEELLASDAMGEGPLDRLAGERFGALLAGAGESAGAAEVGAGGEMRSLYLDLDDVSDASDTMIGRQVGPYHIVRRIGQGAMGVVFAARQQRPSRLVALKILRAGALADQRQLRRFAREVESLARLSHPRIAAIHDAGRTEDGLHYFAMELVDGEPLDAHLRARPGPTTRGEIDARLALFLEICDAISHAHQRGVIHLDLKPANIMVLSAPAATRGAAPPGIKVLDFGVGRIVGAEGPTATVTQDARAILGTLAYMSPEQAAGDVAAVDVRSDIYALGVLLHEMLTGRLPLDLSGRSLPEAVRLIREQSPRRPDERSRLLRGDLAAIILKALQKDPRERYQSTAALAEDVQRLREGQPILGRPPSTLYQLRLIVRQHRVAIGFAAVLLASLVATVGGTTFGLLRAKRAETAARLEAAAAEETARFLEEVFRVADPGESRGNAVTARELLDQAAAGIGQSFAGQAALQGRLLGTMGQAYRNLGLYREARPLLEQAVAQLRAAHGRDDARTARGHYTLAGLLRRLGEFDAAREHYAEALAIREQILGPEHPDFAVSLAGLANLLVDRGELDQARELYLRALAIIARDRGEEGPRYASHLANLAICEWNRGDLEVARGHFERVVEIQRRALPANDLDLAWSLSVLAALYEQTDRLDQARALCAQALAIQEAVLGPEHGDVAETLNVLANLHRRTGDHVQALGVHRRAAAIWEKTVGAEHPTYAMALDHVAQDLGALGRLDEALDHCLRAGAIFARALPVEHPSIATNLVIHGRLCLLAGDAACARAALQRALALRETHRPDQNADIDEVRALLERVERGKRGDQRDRGSEWSGG